MPDETRLLGIEDRLAADAGGTERDALLARLAELRAIAKLSLDKGVPPAQGVKWMALLTALDAAERTVRGVWAHLHRPGR